MYVTFITTHHWPSGFCPHGYRGNARATPPSPSLAQLGTWGYGVPTQACVPVTSFIRILHRGYQFTTYRVIQVIRSYRLFVAPQSRLLPRHAAPHIHTYMVPTATAPNAVPALPGVIYPFHANVHKKDAFHANVRQRGIPSPRGPHATVCGLAPVVRTHHYRQCNLYKLRSLTMWFLRCCLPYGVLYSSLNSQFRLSFPTISSSSLEPLSGLYRISLRSQLHNRCGKDPSFQTGVGSS